MPYDVVIVGGGAMGSATAFHLKRLEPSVSVVVIERDSSYEHASTVLSDGNVRVQFNLGENIRISQYMLEVLETFTADMATATSAPDPAARHQGNLFMTTGDGMDAALAGLAAQRSFGCEVEWLDSDEVAARFPPYRSEGLAGGTFGARDGAVDPTAVLRGFRAKAIELGVHFVEARVDRLLVDGERRAAQLEDGEVVEGNALLCTAGAWTGALMRTIGIELPVEPVMRTVYVVSSTIETTGLPSVFIPNGVYALPEGESTWLMAWSQPDDPVGFDFRPAPRSRFTDLIWPELVAHFPAFDALRVESSWAGLYALNTLDGNGIIGEWPERRGIYLATGFSGHGFQQCAAVGRYLAEKITGAVHAIDLSRLGPERVIANTPLYEHAGRII